MWDFLSQLRVVHEGKEEAGRNSLKPQCYNDGSCFMNEGNVHSSIRVKIFRVTSIFWPWSSLLWSVEITLLFSSHPPSLLFCCLILPYSLLSVCSFLSPVWLFATPARLLHPWNSPGKCTGVSCHSLLQGIFPTQVSWIPVGFSTIWATREARTNPELQLGNSLKVIQAAARVTSGQRRAWVQLQPLCHVSETYWVIIASCPPKEMPAEISLAMVCL